MLVRKKGKNYKKIVTFLCMFLFSIFMLTGCVDQSGGGQTGEETDGVISESNDDTINDSPRVIATSMAVVEICDKLGIDLVGVPESSLTELPERYEGIDTIGTPMSPDIELLSAKKPDWILSPVSLISDLQPKYEELDTEYAFLNLNSVQGMYKSIIQLGQIFGKEEEAQALVDEFTSFYDNYKKASEEKEAKTVLILMGLPGSYVVATENSYVGSLVAMAGGKNVYAGEEADFLNINTEDMLKKDPDIILRTAHALPDQVMEMFAEEFKTNDIWKHFKAVENDKVYDLSYEKFGMSANFNYQEALEELQTILYGE